MKEDIIAFGNTVADIPFIIDMCGISYCDGTYKINRPNSKICCIEYIYKGTGFVKCDDVEFSPCKGDVYILPCGKNHFYYSDNKNPWEKIWFNVRGEFVEKVLESYKLTEIYHIKSIDIAPLFEHFLKEAENIRNEEKAEYTFDICAVDFLKIIQRLAAHIRPKKTISLKSAEERLKQKIDGVTDFSMTFDEILKDFYYTKSHIIRIFKKKYNVTPYEYFLERKADTAKMLMRNTAMSIKEISDYLGFSDSRYFSNFFKKRTGMSPRAYKNKH